MFKALLKTMAVPFALAVFTGGATISIADDTELYSATYQAGATGKPKVLVIFDDSGSMDEVVKGAKPDYDPSATYVGPKPPGTEIPADRIYWSTGNTSGPPPVDSSQWFPASKNSCAGSYTPLSQQGTYNGSAKRWQPATGSYQNVTVRVCTRRFFGICTRWEDQIQRQWTGTAAGWTDLSSSVTDPYTVDCAQDTQNPTNPVNASPIADGYPRSLVGVPDAANSEAYTPLAINSNVNWSDNHNGYKFYTSHYMNWYYEDNKTEDKDYLQIAQEVIENIVMANPNIDFGLEVFNDNTSSNDHGGRIVQRIIDNMTEDDRDDLVDVLWGLDHEGNTPLCESAYESYLYMAGLNRKYGISGDSKDVPLRDTLAEKSGKYISPLEACANTYMIIMTDGLPTSDTDANTLIKSLVGIKSPADCPNYCSIDEQYGDEVCFRSCMAPLLEYMADKDLSATEEGFQTVKTATIGFNVDPRADEFLTDAATLTKSDGTPAYYTAALADDLTDAFNDILLGILSTETTFTSPSVAVNTFTRTQSRDDVFFAMFEPKADADWWGNIKKLKLTINNAGAAVLVDSAGDEAFTSQGLIKDSARTYWSPPGDGPTVTVGGVGGLLQARALNSRTIVTNTGTNGALEALSTANVDAAAYGLGTSAELYAYWQVTNATDLANSIAWGWGYDTEDLDNDDSRTDTRSWIMADILHSTPLVINYGALGSYTEANPDLRIVVGTNNGLLHMFGNDDGQEDWAFFPKELGPVLTKRRKNIRNDGNVYGVDAPTTAFTLDVNQDGTLDHTDGDKVYLYFGLRGGGNMIYALDISDPDDPTFMWAISPESTGFAELGQTWSVPVVTRIPGYKDNAGKAKPVLIFGGGYDEINDSHTSFANTDADTMGRGVFIVDAETGALVWSVTPAANSTTNMQETGLAHAIAADVTPVDSNGDGLSDRIYAADVGGNLWRIDLPGDTLPTSTQDTWFITHVFKSNGNTQTTDRRFFNAPDVVRTTVGGTPVDAIMIGSGDRTNPIAKDNPDDEDDRTVDDQFYMIRDMRTVPYLEAFDEDACDDEDIPRDLRCDLPMEPDDLYDITENLIQSEDEDEQAAAALALQQARGWRLDLIADGEKALARSLTISGKLFFTTFSPVIDLVGCGFSAGTGRLYVIDMLNGGELVDFNEDGDKERFWTIGGLIPQTPSPYFGPDGQIWLLLPPGDSGGAQTTGNPFETGATLPGPYGSYWNRGDYP